jgi:hypothetical protein
MLLPTSFVVIGISFPLLTLSAPIKCPPGAPCIPDPWREDPAVAKRSSGIDIEVAERGNPFPKPYPGPTFPDPPLHPDEEKRQAPTGTWPYYGYPVKPGPVKIERSADPEPDILDVASQPEERQVNEPATWPYTNPPKEGPPRKITRSIDPEPYPGPTFPDPPLHPDEEKRQAPTGTWPYYGYPVKPGPVKIERSADPEPDNDQPEKRQGTSQWPYYGYPVKPVTPGPVKIERSASPEPVQGPTEPDPEHGVPHPHYIYQDKRSAEAEADPTEVGPWGPHPPHYDYSDPALEKREASLVKLPGAPGGNGGGPRYLYQDSEKRGTDEEAPKSTPSATPYYGYRVPEKREEAPKSTPTATPYYGYRVPEKRDEAPKSTPTSTPYYGYRVPDSDS